MQPFAVGNEYIRERLLDFVGSRQVQSGVIWGPIAFGPIVCTSGGRHGKKAGYLDELLPDGSWRYFGQGTNGNQALTNPANSKLATRQHAILLFTAREPTAKEVSKRGGYGKLYRYRGLFKVAGHDFHVPMTGIRVGDRLIRFHLVPSEDNNQT